MNKLTGTFSTDKMDIADKLDIYYELVGADDLSGHKRLVILLHEGLGSTGQWKDFPVTLAKALQLPVLNYDRMGYGKSSPLEKRGPSYLSDEAECVLPRLLQYLKFDGKYILFGHSDGATIALMHAALYPGRVERVIAEAPHVIIEKETISGVHSAIRNYTEGELKPRLQKYHGEITDQMFWGWANFWSHDDQRKWNMLSLLQRIESPVLFIQGDKDNFGTLQQGLEISLRILGDYEELILENCGHIPHFEAKQEVVRKISAFVN